MNASEIESLFAQTLVGEYDSNEVCAAIATLRSNGSREIFTHAADWCHSEDPQKRERAVAVLCQLRASSDPNDPQWLFRDESYSLIVKILEHEKDPFVLESGVGALGHLEQPEAIPVILRYQDHADKKVRLAAAIALGCFPNDDRSIEGLLRLSQDPEPEIRDWAVFGLGVLGETDSPEIREALLLSLDDIDEDVREEAAVGLGKRRDERLLPKLWSMLDGEELKVRVAEAASYLLGLDADPPDWTAEDCKAAPRKQFPGLSDEAGGTGGQLF